MLNSNDCFDMHNIVSNILNALFAPGHMTKCISDDKTTALPIIVITNSLKLKFVSLLDRVAYYVQRTIA